MGVKSSLVRGQIRRRTDGRGLVWVREVAECEDARVVILVGAGLVEVVARNEDGGPKVT